MTSLLDAITGAESGADKDPRFPHAPEGWTPAAALAAARAEGLEPGEDHWEALRALQEFFARHETPGVNLRELHDALDEKFHHQGGIRHLYRLFPGGPVAQGCRLAGLKVPAGAIDKSFGSVA
ncbi:MAG TPA: TusE/DsrC/DsvC family sulfur relay protein [Burkholderiales bacterium]|nr:TusE/DsrC/DsvC family sulfur relay protein [Burkholderiales bacterium]